MNKNNAILIADSGSTKTDWAVVYAGKTTVVQCEGMNPYHCTDRELRERLVPVVSQCPSPAEIYFYGSGCTPDKIPMMERILIDAFPKASVAVHSDILGAARALCGRERGVACIMGTGSNACLYDGCSVIDSTPSLGYILGDEGSGSYLGKQLLNTVFKQPASGMASLFFTEYPQLSQAEVVERIYRQPFPARYLASFAPFIARHFDMPEIRELCYQAFHAFFERNVKWRDAPVNLTGSIAFHFQEIITEVLHDLSLTKGKILPSPIGGLAEYHYLCSQN